MNLNLSPRIFAAALAVSALSVMCFGQTRMLPPLRRQATPEKVVKEHLAAFSTCDWSRLMAQYPEDVALFFPNGMLVRGRQAVAEMFAKVTKPPAEGGTCGLKITTEQMLVIGETVNVQWRADAPFLAEPYRGADAYETHDGLMAAQVSTFDGAALKYKKGARVKSRAKSKELAQ